MGSRTVCFLAFLFILGITFGAVDGPISASASNGPGGQPTLLLSLDVRSFDPNTQSVNASFGASLTNYNSSAQYVGLEIMSVPYQETAYIQLAATPGGEYSGTSAPVVMTVSSYSVNFPFDSYDLTLNTTGLPVQIPITIYLSYSRYGPYLNLLSQWSTTGLYPHPIQGTTGRSFTITWSRNMAQSITEILPVWIGFALLGSLYFIKPTESDKRLMVLTSLFVFAPVFLLAVSPNIPLRFSTSLFEWQLSILLAGVGIEAVESVIASRTEIARRHFYADATAVIVIEMMFLLLEILFVPSTFPLPVLIALVLPVTAFFVPAAVAVIRERP